MDPLIIVGVVGGIAVEKLAKSWKNSKHSILPITELLRNPEFFEAAAFSVRSAKSFWTETEEQQKMRAANYLFHQYVFDDPKVADRLRKCEEIVNLLWNFDFEKKSILARIRNTFKRK